jgi:hypothetical protein
VRPYGIDNMESKFIFLTEESAQYIWKTSLEIRVLNLLAIGHEMWFSGASISNILELCKFYKV